MVVGWQSLEAQHTACRQLDQSLRYHVYIKKYAHFIFFTIQQF